MEPLTVLGIPGSLRRESLNRRLLGAAAALAPAGMRIEIYDLGEIPLYNPDFESPLPAAVAGMKRLIRGADAVLIATPEYNYSVPGVLKNAIDWAARPYGDSAWDGRPAAVMGASVSSIGTARAQYHLRQTLTALNCYTLNQPEVLLGQAERKFDGEGKLVDAEARESIVRLLEGLAGWIRKLR